MREVARTEYKSIGSEIDPQRSVTVGGGITMRRNTWVALLLSCCAIATAELATASVAYAANDGVLTGIVRNPDTGEPIESGGISIPRCSRG